LVASVVELTLDVRQRGHDSRAQLSDLFNGALTQDAFAISARVLPDKRQRIV
jgi:hypothetical protein